MGTIGAFLACWFGGTFVAFLAMDLIPAAVTGLIFALYIMSGEERWGERSNWDG